MKILFIEDKLEKIRVAYNEGDKKINIKANKFIDSLCIESLSTTKGRKESFKKLFNCKYNIPVYVNNETLLIKVKSNNIVWINYYQIEEIYYENKKIILIFKNGRIIKMNLNYNTFMKKIKMVKDIDIYIQKKLR